MNTYLKYPAITVPGDQGPHWTAKNVAKQFAMQMIQVAQFPGLMLKTLINP